MADTPVEVAAAVKSATNAVKSATSLAIALKAVDTAEVDMEVEVEVEDMAVDTEVEPAGEEDRPATLVEDTATCLETALKAKSATIVRSASGSEHSAALTLQ